MLTGQEIKVMYRRVQELTALLDSDVLLSGFDAIDMRDAEDTENRMEKLKKATAYDILEGQFQVSRRESVIGENMDTLVFSLTEYYQALDDAESALFKLENALLTIGFVAGVYDPDRDEDNTLHDLMSE